MCPHLILTATVYTGTVIVPALLSGKLRHQRSEISHQQCHGSNPGRLTLASAGITRMLCQAASRSLAVDRPQSTAEEAVRQLTSGGGIEMMS